MRSPRTALSFAVLAASLALAQPLLAQPDGPPPEVRRLFDALLHMLRSPDPDGPGDFIAAWVDPALLASEGEEALTARLRELRVAARGAGDGVEVRGRPGDVVLELAGSDARIGVTFAGSPPRLTGIELRTVPDSPSAAPLTWESLPDRLLEAERGGFSGVVLARRDGTPFHEGSYGLADRDEGRPTTTETVYGIGSTPIDFTAVAALLLADRGLLALDDPIARFLPGVPEDKRAITIEHLMTGRSGLEDFHDLPQEDWDPDLAWIDRATAVQRILGRPLRFAPGTDEAHSHSAWGLVAAIVEIASGRPYREFVREEILEPAGMTRTGFYGETLGLAREDFAVGYGPSSVGLPNIPPNWGPTSWLVMGSGGMFSTLGDMDRFHRALADGRLDVGGWERWLGGESVDVGGSDRGFFYFRAADGRGDSVLLLMNGEGRSPEVRALTRALESLVLAEAAEGP